MDEFELKQILPQKKLSPNNKAVNTSNFGTNSNGKITLPPTGKTKNLTSQEEAKKLVKELGLT